MLIDDHPVVRRGVRDLLSDAPDLEVVGEAADFAEAVARVRETRPDLAVIDLSLGRGSGLDLIKQLRPERPDLRILVLSIHDEKIYAERALRAGADGYLSKSESADRLIEAIRKVLAGRTALTQEMTDRLVQQAVRGESAGTGGIATLTDRELEVFQMIGGGLSTRKIAERLSISIKTVETHREHIKRKLGAADAAELARHAVAWVESGR